ncbi:MAG: hypothetical protein ACRC0A_01615 [Chitinophagaceae bacterium]
MITNKLICEKYLQYISDEYIDFNGTTQQGQGKLNFLLYNYGIGYKLLGNYSNGFQKHWADDYCLVLQPRNDQDKNRGLIDGLSYQEDIHLDVTMKLSVDSSLAYVLFNFIPEIMNILAINFVNDVNLIENPLYNLSFSAESHLESDSKSPNPFSTVTAVQITQDIRLSRQIQIQMI